MCEADLEKDPFENIACSTSDLLWGVDLEASDLLWAMDLEFQDPLQDSVEMKFATPRLDDPWPN